MTFNELMDSIIEKLSKKTNNKTTNAGLKITSNTLTIFREEFGDQLYTQSEILKALNEAIMENNTGKYVYVDDFLYELKEARK